MLKENIFDNEELVNISKDIRIRAKKNIVGTVIWGVLSNLLLFCLLLMNMFLYYTNYKIISLCAAVFIFIAIVFCTYLNIEIIKRWKSVLNETKV